MTLSDTEDLLDADPPTKIDPYAVLSLETDATPEQIKTAYRKAALLNHPGTSTSSPPNPRTQTHQAKDILQQANLTSHLFQTPTDKVPEAQKPTAHAKFQEIAFAYAILSDKRRRARYDATGRTEETLSLDDDDDDFSWTDFFRTQFTDVITQASVDAFRKEYKNSEEEREAILAAYTRGKGDMDRVYEAVMLSDPFEDDERFRAVLDKAIEEGEVEAFKKYTQESEASKKKRLDKARKEAEEAEEMVREMEDKPKGKKGKKPAASKSKGGKNDLGSLAALIQQRQKGRADNFLADLEAKYGGGKKRGSPALYDEPSEEAFQKTAARGKKAKAAKEEASGAAGDGSRSKRARK